MSLPITFCDGCFPASYSQCEDLIFPVGLTPATPYKAVVTNHFGQKYQQNVTTDSGGAIELLIDNFPEGFFSPDSGFFTLEVQLNGVNQDMIIQYSTYTCVSFDIYTLTVV